MTGFADDPLAVVAALPGVAEAVASARAAIDPLLLDRRLRGSSLPAEAALRNAHASATLEGAEVPIEELRDGGADAPLLRVASTVLEAQRALRGMLALPPRQAWATLATMAGREYLSEDRRGRPRRDDERAEDPLHLGIERSLEDVAVRMAMLAEVLQQPTTAPALVAAAIAHGEIVALQPFGAGNGVVARAYSQLLLAQRGLDPDFLAMTDVGMLSMGRAAYVRAIRAYDAGDGVAEWCVHVCAAFERGALLARQSLD